MGGASADRVTATEADNLGQAEGAETHTLITSEMPAHTHEVAGDPNNNAGADQATSSSSGTANTTGSTGGDGAHNNVQPYQTLNWIIKHGV
jgi:microcystin-dependent protein